MFEHSIKALFFAVIICGVPLCAQEKPRTEVSSKLLEKSCDRALKASGSFYGDTQVIYPINEPVALIFNYNQLPPKHIRRPIAGDATMFEVRKSGTYSISWIVSCYCVDSTQSGNPDFVGVNVYDVTTNRNIPIGNGAQFMQASTVDPNTYIPLSGQTFVKLKKGTVLQVTLTRQQITDILTISNPVLNIQRVAD